MVFGLIVDIRDLVAYKGEPRVYPEKTAVRFILENRTPFGIEVNVEVSYISRGREVDEDSFSVFLPPSESRETHSVSDWVVESVDVRASKGPIPLDNESADP